MSIKYEIEALQNNPASFFTNFNLLFQTTVKRARLDLLSKLNVQETNAGISQRASVDCEIAQYMTKSRAFLIEEKTRDFWRKAMDELPIILKLFKIIYSMLCKSRKKLFNCRCTSETETEEFQISCFTF